MKVGLNLSLNRRGGGGGGTAGNWKDQPVRTQKVTFFLHYIRLLLILANPVTPQKYVRNIFLLFGAM